jgi:beta-glucanase (GH16 family)
VVSRVDAGPDLSAGADPSPGSRVHRTRTRSKRFRRRALLGLALAIVVAVAVVVVSVVATSTSPKPKPSRPAAAAGLSLAFHPKFSGKTLDTGTWNTCYAYFVPATGCANFGNPVRDAWYLPSGDKVSGGVLHLVATAKPTKGQTKTGAPLTYPYTSGMVTTMKSFSFTYGYVQIVAKIPGGTGTWPALWLLPTSETWPPEIDIMENFGSTHTIRTTVFWSAAGAYDYADKTARSSSNLTAGYHTYGLLWKPNSLTWYLDGKVIDRYTGNHVPDQPMYLLANLAIDGKAPPKSTFSISSVEIYR